MYRHIRLGPLNGLPNGLKIDHKDPQLDPETKVDPRSKGGLAALTRSQRRKGTNGGAYSATPSMRAGTHQHPELADSWVGRPRPAAPAATGQRVRLDRPGRLDTGRIVTVARSPVLCNQRQPRPPGLLVLHRGQRRSRRRCRHEHLGVRAGQHLRPAADRRLRTTVVIAITTRILSEFARGPAGRRHPIPAVDSGSRTAPP